MASYRKRTQSPIVAYLVQQTNFDRRKLQHPVRRIEKKVFMRSRTSERLFFCPPNARTQGKTGLLSRGLGPAFIVCAMSAGVFSARFVVVAKLLAGNDPAFAPGKYLATVTVPGECLCVSNEMSREQTWFSACPDARRTPIPVRFVAMAKALTGIGSGFHCVRNVCRSILRSFRCDGKGTRRGWLRLSHQAIASSA